MLRNVIKYDWKATWKIPLLLDAAGNLLYTAVAAVLFYFLTERIAAKRLNLT